MVHRENLEYALTLSLELREDLGRILRQYHPETGEVVPKYAHSCCTLCDQKYYENGDGTFEVWATGIIFDPVATAWFPCPICNIPPQYEPAPPGSLSARALSAMRYRESRLPDRHSTRRARLRNLKDRKARAHWAAYTQAHKNKGNSS